MRVALLRLPARLYQGRIVNSCVDIVAVASQAPPGSNSQQLCGPWFSEMHSSNMSIVSIHRV
eukprot:5116424-Lingulodinium_polyedra.AAC.1